MLPDDLLARETKAGFAGALFTARSREFVEGWEGPAPFPELVDTERLRRAFARGEGQVFPRSLIQATWLANARAVG